MIASRCSETCSDSDSCNAGEQKFVLPRKLSFPLEHSSFRVQLYCWVQDRAPADWSQALYGISIAGTTLSFHNILQKLGCQPLDYRVCHGPIMSFWLVPVLSQYLTEILLSQILTKRTLLDSSDKMRSGILWWIEFWTFTRQKKTILL